MPEPVVNSRLIDLLSIREDSLEELFGIFDKISALGLNGHLLILDKRLSARVNALTTFSRLRDSTGISKVIWLDLENEHHYDYNLLSQEFGSFVVVLDVVTLNDLTELSRFLKERMAIFGAQNKTSVSLILADSGKEQACQMVLEGQGVWGDLKGGVYHWQLSNLVALDSDLVCLDLPQAGLRQLLKYGSIDPIEQLARAFLRLVVKSNYKIRTTSVYLKGEWSGKFWKIYNKLYKEHVSRQTATTQKLIDDQDETLFSDQFSFFNRNVDLVCLDRGVDLMGCLLSQLSYSGICDEVIGTDLGVVRRTSIGSDAEPDPPYVRLGDPADPIYPTIRDLNFSMVGSILNTKARELQTEFDRRNKLNSIDEMKKFVGELNQLKEVQGWVQKHTTLAEQIIRTVKPPEVANPLESILTAEEAHELPGYNYFDDFVELQQDIIANGLDSKRNCAAILDLMYKYEPPVEDIVRLLIMTSIVKKGVREPEYNSLKTAILDQYGIRYLSLLIKLRELKFVYPREPQLNFLGSSTTLSESEKMSPMGRYQLVKDFSGVAHSMNLLPATHDQALLDPAQPDFAFPGYVPLTCRLVQSIYDRSFLEGSKPDDGVARYKKCGWENLPVLASDSQLDGETYEELLVPHEKKAQFSSLVPPKMSQLSSYYKQRRDMIVVAVIGGITYSEVATIRHVLSKNEVTSGRQLVILTTGIITGSDVIDALI